METKIYEEKNVILRFNTDLYCMIKIINDPYNSSCR